MHIFDGITNVQCKYIQEHTIHATSVVKKRTVLHVALDNGNLISVKVAPKDSDKFIAAKYVKHSGDVAMTTQPQNTIMSAIKFFTPTVA